MNPKAKPTVLVILLTVLFVAVLRGQNNPSDFIQITEEARAKHNNQQWNEAIPLWEKALSINSTRANVWFNLANALYENKKFNEAIPAFKKAMELGWTLPCDKAFNIALCFAQLNNADSCYYWLNKSFSLGFAKTEDAKKNKSLEPFLSDERFKNLFWLSDVKKMNRNQGWAYDLDYLYAQIKRVGYRPFKKFSEKEFDATVNDIRKKIDTRTDMQMLLEFERLVAMVGDGHSQVYNLENKDWNKEVPLRMAFFEEGVFITAADSVYSSLIGKKIESIDGVPVSAIVQKLVPFIGRDNDMWIETVAPSYLRSASYLHALGIAKKDDELGFSLSTLTGEKLSVTLKTKGNEQLPIHGPASGKLKTIIDQMTEVPLLYKNISQPYWFEYLEKNKTVYFHFRAVANDKKEPLAVFTKRLMQFINENEVEKLVIDMRENGGGNNTLLVPLIQAVYKNDKINQQGKLFCLIGRKTFSAAQNFINYLELFSNVTFVGQPSGSSPNFVGEVNRFQLPYTRLYANVSNLYWANSYATDNRTWIGPHIYVPLKFSAISQGKDEALEAILSLK